MHYETTIAKMKILDYYSKAPTRVIGLGNMFDLNDVKNSKDPNFFKTLKREVKEECDAYGEVRDVKIDKKNMVIFIKFKNNEDALMANSKLQDREFAQKSIVTEFFTEKIFN